MRSIPELLSPAGNSRSLQTAIRFGADAVYLGGERFSLRAKARNFDEEALASAVEEAHAAGVCVYLALNIFAFDGDFPEMEAAAAQAKEVGADAVIIADIGVASQIHKTVPSLPIHVSTQANITNAAAANVWQKAGATRIVVARELSIKQIAAMSKEISGELELEAFIHGSMCMAWSGRCFLSKELNGRSANRGLCTQPCRWEWTVSETGKPENRLFVEEWGEQSEIFSSRDLCMINNLAELWEAGVTSFKIEGRTKSEYYVGIVTGAYRRRMETVFAGAPRTDEMRELCSVSHRPYGTGFYFGAPERGNDDRTESGEREYVGFVLDVRDGRALVEMKNRFYVGDTLETVTPAGCESFLVQDITIADTGDAVSAALIPGQHILLPCPVSLASGDMLRGPLRNRKKDGGERTV